jgi:hypothetical protein
MISGNVASTFRNGYEFLLSGTNNPYLVFNLFSGALEVSVSTSFGAFTGSWHSVAAIYDQGQGSLSLYVDNAKYATSSSLGWKAINFNQSSFYIGSRQHIYDFS